MNENPFRENRILLVEDEESLAKGLEYNLGEEGYRVEWVTDGRQALERIGNNEYDLVILDIMLPYVDGFTVAREIRKTLPQLPVLMLTARGGIQDRVEGLEAGADDYVSKPFHLQELLLRVRGMLRRKNWYKASVEEMPVYRFGGNEIRFTNFMALAGTQEIQLTLYEAMLMKYLIERKGSAVSRQELLANVWNTDPELETRTVDNFIARLRKYFEADPGNPRHIKSVRGVGYIFSD